MFEIVTKQTLAPNLTQYEIRAPRIARSRKPGQFVMVRPNETGERVPLTVADVNPEAGTITLIVQTVGRSTRAMAELSAGQAFKDVAGPMGMPSHFEKYGTVVVVGGGLGTAVVYPQARALKEMGNKVISIIGARAKDLLILVEQLGSVSDEVICITDDGSSGKKGFVTDAMREVINRERIDAVYTAGPVIMMKNLADVTRPLAIPIIVSLNPIMVDGTGMCGGCRVTVGGEIKFACVDGPEFEGHKVDFAELMSRLTIYKDHENHHCKLAENKATAVKG